MYFASSETSNAIPFKQSSLKTGILYFLENSTNSVFDLELLPSLQLSSFNSKESSEPNDNIVYIYNFNK